MQLSEAAVGAGRKVNVHFKVDTGMTRLGAPVEDAPQRYRAISELRNVIIDGLMTHLATADERDIETAREQLQGFAEVLAEIGDPPRYVHAQNSAGIAAFGLLPGINATRPGVSLYGLHAAPHLVGALALQPALEWRSRIRRIENVWKGAGVSYGHEYRMPRDGRVATVPVGYGDGFARSLGKGGHVLIGGRSLPIAGRVTMDHVMVDVSDLPEVREGDEVVIIGAQGRARQSSDDLANAVGTINYEIVTAISRRVPRRYHQGGRVVGTRTLAEGYMRT
jgi:alanine racemase